MGPGSIPTRACGGTGPDEIAAAWTARDTGITGPLRERLMDSSIPGYR